MRHLWPLALVSCMQTPGRQLPPPGTMDLTVSHVFVQGETTRLHVSDAPPNSLVVLAASSRTQGRLACPQQLSPVCLDLIGPVVRIADGQSDANGNAQLDVAVPAGSAGMFVRLQAVAIEPGGAATSNLVHADVLAVAPRQFEHDLDGDGIGDTDLALAACGSDLCLEIDSRITTRQSITIANGVATGRAVHAGQAIRVIGDHEGGDLAEVAITHQIDRGTHDSPALSVLDIDAGTVRTASAPAHLDTFHQYNVAGWVDAVEDPTGRLHPFLAPSYGDTPHLSWGHLCQYRPASTGGTCGDGFQTVDTSLTDPTNWFREVGGTLYDLDADGWEDIQLIYHQTLLSISGRTGARLNELRYDLAAHDEPNAPPWFHSGRNYGSHVTYTADDGMIRHLQIGGSIVGSFDANCNVSRFVSSLASTPGAPSTRHLAWSDYRGFASNAYGAYDLIHANDPGAVLSRAGNFVDQCVHRFGDGLTRIDGAEAVIFNYFSASALVDDCVDEQYQLYVDPPWTDAKVAVWQACNNSNLGSMGTWGMQALRADDGVGITGSQRTYMWGQTDQILPSGETVYLTERLPPQTRFDMTDAAPSELWVYALVNGLFSQRGRFPVAGRPRVVQSTGTAAQSYGAFARIAELSLVDADEDGIMDVVMDDGTVIGWDGTDFVVK